MHAMLREKKGVWIENLSFAMNTCLLRHDDQTTGGVKLDSVIRIRK
jgi:hypothetical protein